MKKPLPPYIKYMRKEESPIKGKLEYIHRYKDGGIPFERHVKEMMGDTRSPFGPTYEKGSAKPLYWIYVGDLWWCRLRKRKHEFAKLVALDNDAKKKIINVVGIWDERKYGSEKPQRIVWKGNQKGYIVGHSKYEMFVQWEKSGKRMPRSVIRSLKDIRFEYDDDDKYFQRLFKKG